MSDTINIDVTYTGDGYVKVHVASWMEILLALQKLGCAVNLGELKNDD